MIKLSELINRKYDEEKKCVAFEYVLNYEDSTGNIKQLRVFYEKLKDLERNWQLNALLQKTQLSGYQVYSFEYEVPKTNMRLELIASIGLKLLQMGLQNEIQNKTSMEFEIGEITKAEN